MTRQRFTDMTFAYTAARLVGRLIYTPSRRAELACRKWASLSPRHREEILKTLATLKSLDSLGKVGRPLEKPNAPSSHSPCRERNAAVTLRPAARSIKHLRARIATRRPASTSFGRTPDLHRKDDEDA
jgi:ferric-dicitrate binding protein FerR (iron transport regulator)